MVQQLFTNHTVQAKQLAVRSVTSVVTAYNKKLTKNMLELNKYVCYQSSLNAILVS